MQHIFHGVSRQRIPSPMADHVPQDFHYLMKLIIVNDDVTP